MLCGISLQGLRLFSNRYDTEYDISAFFDIVCGELIRDRLVIGIKSHEVRKRLLREKALTLNTALDIIRAAETASDQLKKIDGEIETSVHAVKYRGKKPDFTQRVETVKQCKYCGTNNNLCPCPAYGKKMQQLCNMKNHFPTRGIHRIEEAEPTITDDEVYCMYSVTDSSRTKYMIQPQIRSGQTSNWIEVTMQIDSGSEANCLRMKDFVKIQNRPDLKKTRAILEAYNGERVFPKAEVYLDIQIEGKITTAKFLVIDNAPSSLSSGKTCEELELLSIKRELLVNSVSDVKGLTKDAILREHNDVFTGLGYIGNYKIELTEGAVPKQDAPRTVPVALRDDLKKKLHEIEQKGHIAKVDEPTDWVSSAVYVKKRNGQLRVCLDPRELNKHVKIPKLCLLTIDDVTSRLAKAQVFTVLEAKDGFLQVKLDEDFSKLTTLHTPFGRYNWLRMPFGICSAPEEFQRHVNEIIEGLEGVAAIADDLLVTGVGNTHGEAWQTMTEI